MAAVVDVSKGQIDMLYKGELQTLTKLNVYSLFIILIYYSN